MYEKILVPLDGSKLGEAGLRAIEELCVSKLSPEVNVEVTLFQAVPLLTRSVAGSDGSAEIPYSEEAMEPFKQNVRDYLNKAGEGFLGNERTVVKTKVSVGNAAEEIIKAAEEVDADMIAMATHGRSGISRWAFGSVADKVLRGANVPVLMVRASEKAERA